MLRDFLYELPELLEDADKQSSDFRSGVFSILHMLENYLASFGIDQSKFARAMPDIEAWYFGKHHE